MAPHRPGWTNPWMVAQSSTPQPSAWRVISQVAPGTKFESFRAELDSQIFPCLGELRGCLDLMSEIAQRATFVPGATWLITRHA
ncbi:MAG: hypothetical protein ACKOFW_08775, partial [Planctomycetaceae bacterium]